MNVPDYEGAIFVVINTGERRFSFESEGPNLEALEEKILRYLRYGYVPALDLNKVCAVVGRNHTAYPKELINNIASVKAAPTPVLDILKVSQPKEIYFKVPHAEIEQIKLDNIIPPLATINKLEINPLFATQRPSSGLTRWLMRIAVGAVFALALFLILAQPVWATDSAVVAGINTSNIGILAGIILIASLAIFTLVG